MQRCNYKTHLYMTKAKWKTWQEVCGTVRVFLKCYFLYFCLLYLMCALMKVVK